MADKTISGLTALPGNLDPAAILAIVQSGVTYKATGQQVIDMIADNMSTVELPVQPFTPEVTAQTGTPTVTYSARAGQYARLGNIIVFSARVNIATISGGSGGLRLNLPTPVRTPDGLNAPPFLGRTTRAPYMLSLMPLGGTLLLPENSDGAVQFSWVQGGDSISYGGTYITP